MSKRHMAVEWTTADRDGSCNNCCSRTGYILAIDIRCIGIRLCEDCIRELRDAFDVAIITLRGES